MHTQVMTILRTMIQVTMMRGAQSGGVATFYPAKPGGLIGVRSRVVNGKVHPRGLHVTLVEAATCIKISVCSRVT